MASTFFRNCSLLKGISGNRIRIGSSLPLLEAGRLQPRSSRHAAHDFEHEHLVEVLAMDMTSNVASRVDTGCTWRPSQTPGSLSVIGRSLSTVFGTWMAWMW